MEDQLLKLDLDTEAHQRENDTEMPRIGFLKDLAKPQAVKKHRNIHIKNFDLSLTKNSGSVSTSRNIQSPSQQQKLALHQSGTHTVTSRKQSSARDDQNPKDGKARLIVVEHQDSQSKFHFTGSYIHREEDTSGAGGSSRSQTFKFPSESGDPI